MTSISAFFLFLRLFTHQLSNIIAHWIQSPTQILLNLKPVSIFLAWETHNTVKCIFIIIISYISISGLHISNNQMSGLLFISLILFYKWNYCIFTHFSSFYSLMNLFPSALCFARDNNLIPSNNSIFIWCRFQILPKRWWSVVNHCLFSNSS